MTTKEVIINKYLELGSSLGFDCFSLTDLANAVGIKKPSLFSHFSGIEEIRQTSISFASESLNNEDFEIDRKASNAEELLVSLINSFIDEFTSFPANAFLSFIEQKKITDAEFAGLSDKIDLMISARLTVALDYCVQRSWSSLPDTDSVASIITPLIRHIIIRKSMTDEDLTGIIHTLVSLINQQ